MANGIYDTWFFLIFNINDKKAARVPKQMITLIHFKSPDLFSADPDP